MTDEAGKILNRYEYDAFGNFTVKEEKVENRFCFTGEQYDPAGNLYYLRARFYSPVIGRFLNEDTYYGDGLNLYAYCHNNPLTYVDPTGHWCEKKQQETVQKYKDKGYSDQDAETMANYERLREEQGVDAAEKYLQEQVRGSGTDALEYKIKQAEQAQKLASELSDKYGYGVAPKKTVASDGTTHTLSGWKTLDENSEFTRVSTDDVINKSNEIGHKLRNAGANDQGVPGRYNASHAEKQLSIISDKPIGISQPMCTDCQGYFKNLAIGEGREYITADPNFIRIFSPDGTVKEIKR